MPQDISLTLPAIGIITIGNGNRRVDFMSRQG
jgi:hypothetical protein